MRVLFFEVRQDHLAQIDNYSQVWLSHGTKLFDKLETMTSN